MSYSLLSLSFIYFFLYCSAHLRDLHSFPTRRSSDLLRGLESIKAAQNVVMDYDLEHPDIRKVRVTGEEAFYQDRKSTRLNSSHRTISYAVFCLKKKNSKRSSNPA